MKHKITIAILILASFRLVHAQGTLVISGSSHLTVVEGSAIINTGDTEILPGATLSNQGTAKLSGNFTNNGEPSVGQGTVLLNGTINQVIGGSTGTKFNNLEIGCMNTILATTASPPLTTVEGELLINQGKRLEIPSEQFLTVSGTITNNAGNSGIYIESDETGTGSLIEYNGPLARAERYISQNCWHYISSPVDNPTASVFMGIYMMKWDEPSESWSYIVNPSYVMETDLQGFAVWSQSGMTGNTTVSFTGNLNTGNKTLLTSNTVGGPNISNGYNFTGNPYPSSLDWNVNDGSGWTRAAGNTDLSLYIWNPVAGNYGVYVKDGVTGTNDVDNFIPPHQGFFIHCSAPAGYISVDNGARIHHSGAILKTITESDVPYFILRVEGSERADEILLILDPESDINFENDKDALKLEGNDDAPQLWAMSADALQVSVDAFPENANYRIIPVGLKTGVSNSYTINLDEYGGELPDKMVLEDLLENTFTQMVPGTQFNFFSDPLDDPSRFLLHLDGIMNVPPIDDNSGQIRIFAFHDEVYVISQKAIDGTLYIYDAGGHCILTHKLQNHTTGKFRVQVADAFYFARIITEDKLVDRKIFIH